MSDDIDERPVWDEGIAESVAGKIMLVGVTYLEADGGLIEQQQFFGTVVSADSRKGILLSLKGQRAGEQYSLPPDTRAIEIASAGEYRLRTTGEVVVTRTSLRCFQSRNRRTEENRRVVSNELPPVT